MLGGLARRVAFVERFRKEQPAVVVVDSGDLFFDTEKRLDPQKALAKARVIARAYRQMGVDAVAVGDTDLIHGVDFLRQEAGQGLPLISANLLDPRKKARVFPAFVLKESSGLRVALVGLTRADPEIQKGLREALQIGDPVAAARETVAGLEGKADLIVILSDATMAEAKEIAKAVPGIHFILGGHEGRYSNYLEREGGTFVGQSYCKGMTVGRLRLTVEEAKGPFQDEGTADRIQEHISNLGIRMRALTAAKERQPTEAIERQIAQTQQLVAKLEQDLARAKETGIKGNRFLWTLESLNSALPEDPQVRSWIRESGIEAD